MIPTKKKKTWKSYVLDTFVMGLVAAIVWFAVVHLMRKPAPPYKDVKVVGVSPVRGGVIISSTFTEGECAFRSMSVYGEEDGSQSPINWNILDGTPSKNYDRKIGKRHMIIKVHTFDSNPDHVVLMTHYDCAEGHDYRQFARVSVDPEHLNQ